MIRIFLIIFFESNVFAQRVVGYYTYWMQGSFQPNDLDLETFTHINHAFAWPNEQGDIIAPTGMLDPLLQTTFTLMIEKLFFHWEDGVLIRRRASYLQPQHLN